MLGAGARVGFNIVGSDDLYGSYGLNTPAYFAYDDVAVRFDTNNPTSLPITQNPLPVANSKKVLHNGQLYILNNGNLYTVMGQGISNEKF